MLRRRQRFVRAAFEVSVGILHERIAIDARRLKHDLRHLLADLRAARLHQRRHRADRLAGGQLVEDAALGGVQRLDLDFEVGELAREIRVLDQGTARSRLHLRDLARLADGIAVARRIGRAALERQQVFGAGPALAFLADEIVHGDLHIVEEDRVDLLIADRRIVERVDRRDGDAGRLHIDEDEADALLALFLLRRAHEAENPVGPLGVGRPGFRAVEDVVIALTLRAHREAGEVRTGTRLGIALAPPDFGIADRRQEFLFLLVRAELHDDGRAHAYAHGTHAWRPGERHLHLVDVFLRLVPARAAMLHRPVRNEPALVGQLLLPRLLVRLVERAVLGERHALLQVVRIILRDPGADFVAEFQFLGGEFQIHLILPNPS